MERNVILKYLRGETSPEERIKMLRWLEEDPAHLEEYKYLRRIFDDICICIKRMCTKNKSCGKIRETGIK